MNKLVIVTTKEVNKMKYEIIGYADTCGASMLHETENYNEAKSWVVGYVRYDGLKQSGYDEILIKNDLGEPQSAFDNYGWTHY